MGRDDPRARRQIGRRRRAEAARRGMSVLRLHAQQGDAALGRDPAPDRHRSHRRRGERAACAGRCARRLSRRGRAASRDRASAGRLRSGARASLARHRRSPRARPRRAARSSRGRRARHRLDRSGRGGRHRRRDSRHRRARSGIGVDERRCLHHVGASRVGARARWWTGGMSARASRSSSTRHASFRPRSRPWARRSPTFFAKKASTSA